MTVEVQRRTTCRLCDSDRVELVVELAPIPLSESYPTSSQEARRAQRFPVDLYMCADCGHVQQLDVIEASSLWDGYTYYSGQAKGMPEHFEQVVSQVIDAYHPPQDALVIDVGSNDGSLLRPFKARGYRVLGIDPATEIARLAIESGIPTVPKLMSLELARDLRNEHGPAHVVTAFNVFAHADDMAGMAESIRHLLHPDGVFVFEVQYLADVIDKVLIATIFHEHICHHSVKPMTEFLGRHGLELIDVERVPIQHGSLIGTAQLVGGKRPVHDSVRELLAMEASRGLDRPATLRAFGTRVEGLRQTTRWLAARWRESGAAIAGYGAARSAPTLIAQLGLTGAIDYIVDDHPQKVNRYSPGDGIPIVPTAELCKRMPDYTVILAWVHAAKIIQTNQEYLAQGGHFVVLCPDTRVVGSRGEVPL